MTAVKHGWRRVARTLFIYFVCLLATGFVWMFALSLSDNSWIRADGSLRISGDEVIFFFVISLLMSLLPSFVAASLSAFAAYMCRKLIWWHAIILMPVAIILAAILSRWSVLEHLGGTAQKALGDPAAFLAMCGLMMIGAQVAWLMSRSMYAVEAGSVK